MNDLWTRFRGEPKRDGSGVALFLGGLGLGAALLYFLDPSGGGRRRAMVRDKTLKAARETRETLERTTRDLAKRARGTLAEAKGRLADVQERLREEPGAIPTPPTTFKS
jgi:hypothetical protein